LFDNLVTLDYPTMKYIEDLHTYCATNGVILTKKKGSLRAVTLCDSIFRREWHGSECDEENYIAMLATLEDYFAE
jgi:hypothetical protein